jgi:hypothetical protein
MSVSLGMRGSLAAAVMVSVVAVLLVGLLGPVSDAWANCPNEELRIGPSAGLPDCRAYELVSPPDKNGGEVDGGLRFGKLLGAPEQAAADGEAVTYGSTTAFLESEDASALTTSQYLSRRAASGWRTQDITPRQQVPGGQLGVTADVPDWSLYQGFSESLENGFLLAYTPQPDPSAPAGFFNPYLRNDANGEYQLLSTETPQAWPPFERVTLGGRGFGAVYAGMSADGQHVIFIANDALTAEAVPGHDNLYEWSAGRPLELVSVLPDGEVASGGQQFPLNEGLQFGTGAASYGGALSSNGMRAFWTSGGRLYMHEITASGARSVEVSASQRGGGGNGSGTFWTANPSGSLVYFTSAEQLTDDATAGVDLYQYDVETGVLSDLTVDPNAGESAGVETLLGSGESESVPYVYFTASGVLADGARAGKENVYVWRGGASEPTFIADLEDGALVPAGDVERGAHQEGVARVSPDGRLLAFQSDRPLTGYDNRPASGACPVPVGEDGPEIGEYGNGEGRCMEVYEYDAQTGRLVCASCNPSGLPPTGQSIVPPSLHLFSKTYGWESSTVQQRYLLDDGRLFFDSEDALLPQATDGRDNVYEYEPEGVGECAASGGGGCIYLLSTGTGSGNSAFLDAGSAGRDVFILTNQQLVAADGDEAIDVYDVREGGGFSEAQAPPCGGEACRPPVTPAPAIYQAPPSATFVGAGNSAAAPTPPAKVKTVAHKRTKKAVKKPGKRKRKPVGRRKSSKAASRGRGAGGRVAGRAASRAVNGGSR